MDRRYNTMFSLVPEQTVLAWSNLPLLFSASYDNNVLHLAQTREVRFEVIVTFGNHPLGGPHHTDENIDINGNGIIDADEHKVKSVIALFEKSVPTQQSANSTLALSDNAGDISTMGTVTFTNPVINLGTTTGTVSVYVRCRHVGWVDHELRPRHRHRRHRPGRNVHVHRGDAARSHDVHDRRDRAADLYAGCAGMRLARR